jgi:hypothetical protein
MRNPTSKLMVTILAGVATWEREIMSERGHCQGLGQVQGTKAEARADAGEDHGAVGCWRDACANREQPEGCSLVWYRVV